MCVLICGCGKDYGVRAASKQVTDSEQAAVTARCLLFRVQAHVVTHSVVRLRRDFSLRGSKWPRLAGSVD